MIYPDATTQTDARTIKNRSLSNNTYRSDFVGEKTNIEAKYCAKISAKILYPLRAEKRLKIFRKICLLFELITVIDVNEIKDFTF